MKENGSELYRITKQGIKTAHQLLQGVPPSELGEDFLGASVILYAFKRLLEDEIRQLENKVNSSQDIKKKRDTLNKTEDLMKTYRDAAGLSGELGITGGD